MRLASGCEPPIAATYTALSPAAAACRMPGTTPAHQAPAAANSAPPSSRRPAEQPDHPPPDVRRAHLPRSGLTRLGEQVRGGEPARDAGVDPDRSRSLVLGRQVQRNDAMSAANGPASSCPARRSRRDRDTEILRSSPGFGTSREPVPESPRRPERVDPVFDIFPLPAFPQTGGPTTETPGAPRPRLERGTYRSVEGASASDQLLAPSGPQASAGVSRCQPHRY